MDATTNRALATRDQGTCARSSQQQQPCTAATFRGVDWQGREASLQHDARSLTSDHAATPMAEGGHHEHQTSAKRRRTNEQGESVSDGDGFDEGEDDDIEGGEGDDDGEGEGEGNGAGACDGVGAGAPDLEGLKKDPQDAWQMMLMQQQAMQMQQATAHAHASAPPGSAQEAADQEQQRQQMEAIVSASSQLPLLPLVLSGNPADTSQQQQQQQQQDGGAHMMTPAAAAAAEAAVAEATAAASQAAAAAATHDAMSLSMGMHWLAAQQQVAAAELDAARRRDPNSQRSLRKPDGTLSDPGLSAAVDAATAAAMAGGADADTAAAMSASIAALMADPAAAAAAAAAMSDPNNPANMQALAQLAQLQSMGQLPPGTSADVLNSSFSALVAAAVGMAALEGGHGGAGAGGLPPGLMGLPDPAVLTGLNMMQQSQGGMEMGMQHAMDMQAQNMAAGQQNKARGRPRKVGTTETTSVAASHGPTGNWMRRFHELAYLADKASLDASKISNATMTVQVQWVNMPEELQSKLSTAPAPIELPSNATVSFLKRAIGRTLGGHLAPTLLRNHANRELISDDPEDQQLAALGIVHNSYILMESDFHPIPNFGLMQTSSTQRLAGVGNPGMGFSTPGSGSRVGSKERFTLTEMYSLVEGMEQHGLKWAKIHKDFKDLENKTQGDLKDKWRNWQRNVANGWTTARVYMPDELKQRIEKMVNDYNQQTANAEGRLMQAPSHGNDAAVAAAMAAHGMHLGLDPSQLVGMDAATAAALAAHHQAHAMHQQHYDAAMVAALAGVGVDPVIAAANQQQQQQQLAAAVSSAAAAAAAAGGGNEHMLSDPSMQQQHRHHQHPDPGAYQQYDPSHGM